MAKTNSQDNINWLLLRSSMMAKQRLMKITEKHDLSPMQALTLCLLEPKETVAMSVISESLACDPSNVTGIVERLTTGGLIERRECATDRRVKTINLTQAGITLRTQIMLKISETDATNLADLDEDELEILKQLLIKTLPKVTATKQYLPATSK
jgi:DNA-binding MarR family transcriptional regulator